MDLGIQGLRVLVTAGASGIGLHISRAFAAEGAAVHICDVDEKSLEELSQKEPRAYLKIV
jgi:NAD(P)-dependent dehydrogenase (short-subunit alcohol dehydrogenase family)